MPGSDDPCHTEVVPDLPPTVRLPIHEARRLWEVAHRRAEAFGAPLDPVDVYRALEDERLAGRPLQYLEGTAAFGPVDLTVDERVLVPRPETEQLWELAERLAPAPTVAVDLGTGSGALAILVARTHPGARVLAVDRSEAAAAVARANAARLAPGVEVLVGDLFDALPEVLEGTVDLVVSNPPYVSEAEWQDLPRDVRREPRDALVAGPDGTEVLDRIAAGVGRWLRPGGIVVCEIGETQGGHVAVAFERAGLEDVSIREDLTGRPRFAVGRRPG